MVSSRTLSCLLNWWPSIASERYVSRSEMHWTAYGVQLGGPVVSDDRAREGWRRQQVFRSALHG